MSNLDKLISIIQKNFKVLIRSKSSALIIILGPLILITLVGLAFGNAEAYRLKIDVYTPTYNELTESLIASLEENYVVQKQETRQACIDDVKLGESNICILFPNNLQVSDQPAVDVSVENEGAPASSASSNPRDITFHVDYSDINLVYNVIETISKKINLRSQALTETLTSDLLDRIGKTQSVIDERLATLTDLTNKTDLLNQQTATIQTQFQETNLEIVNDSNSLVGVQHEIDNLRLLTYQSLVDSDELIDSLNAEVNSLRGNKSRVEYYLDTAEEDIVQRTDQLKNTDARLKQVVGNLHLYLGDVNTKLDRASGLKENTSVQFIQIKAELESNLALLQEMQSALPDVKQLTSTLQVTNASVIASPLTTRIVPVSKEKTHFNYLLPTLIVLVVMITGILLSSTLLVVEKRSKSYFRNMISPTPDTIFILGAYFTSILIILAQLFVFFFVAVLFFETGIFQSFGKLLFALVSIASLFIFVGVILGVLLKTEETTTLASISVASVLLFFSNTLIPLESMPNFFQTLTVYNPFVLSQDIIRESLLFQVDMWIFLDNLSSILLLAGVFFVVAVILQRSLRNQKFFSESTPNLWKASRMGHGVQTESSRHDSTSSTSSLASSPASFLLRSVDHAVGNFKHAVQHQIADFHKGDSRSSSSSQRLTRADIEKLPPLLRSDAEQNATQKRADISADISKSHAFFAGSDEETSQEQEEAHPEDELELALLGDDHEIAIPRSGGSVATASSTKALVSGAVSAMVPIQSATSSAISTLSTPTLPSNRTKSVEAEIQDLKTQLQRLS